MNIADAKKRFLAFWEMPFSTWSANSQLRNWQMQRENKLVFSDTSIAEYCTSSEKQAQRWNNLKRYSKKWLDQRMVVSRVPGSKRARVEKPNQMNGSRECPRPILVFNWGTSPSFIRSMIAPALLSLNQVQGEQFTALKLNLKLTKPKKSLLPTSLRGQCSPRNCQESILWLSSYFLMWWT